MRIGIVSYWFNRGQAVVARQVRSAFDGLGHETFVLARPTRESNVRRTSFIDRTGVWDQPRVREASAYEIPASEYIEWAEANDLEVVFFDQNYGFEQIAELRRSGVRTLGRFVWEQFAPEHVGPATEALDVVYSLTACERERYAKLGIESPRVPWGIHPELLEVDGGDKGAAGGTVTFFFPGGMLSDRKPTAAVLKAFRGVRRDDVRLVLKAQVERRSHLLDAAREDPRVDAVVEDLPTDEHLRRFASADVCLAPSRWEGLGLHLFEATAFGLPVITNNKPPMDEVVEDGVNGVLVGSRRRGRTRSGVRAYEPSVRGLRRAIADLADAERRAALAEGARRRRAELSWDRTVAGYERLLELVS
jgi:glycosyltransferase involved in cell wall biosynthesis